MFNKYRDVLFVATLCVIPTFFWFLFSFSAQLSFSTMAQTLKSLGQLSAIIGSVLFCFNYILSTRYKPLERLFYGLNRIYLWHHYLGAASFILLLFHPIFLGIQNLLFSIKLAYTFFIPPFTNYPVWFGITALLTLIILLFLTFYVRLHYDTWKFTHKFLGVALVFAFFHILLVPGNLTTNKPLHWYLVGMGIAALYAFLYRTILTTILVKRYEYTVTSIMPKGQDILEIFMKPKNQGITFSPGQFIYMDVESLGIKHEEHPFSLTTAPTEQTLGVAVKSLGDYTETLKLTKINSQIMVEGPYGRFSYENVENNKQIWIAGGIGITPFLSMAKSLPKNTNYMIDVYYIVSIKEEAVYLLDLLFLQQDNSSLNIIPFISKEQGHISGNKIKEMTSNILERDIFLCGPPPMMKSLRKQLVTLGVKNNVIHSEQFNLV